MRVFLTFIVFSCFFFAAIGYGLSNSSFSLALNSFFRVNLNKASGIAMTLAGIGPIVYPPLITMLLHVYGVRGCMLIIGAIALHMLLAATLLQPLKWHLKKDLTTCELPFKDFPNFPAILPNVSTFLSIGKYSDSSCESFNINLLTKRKLLQNFLLQQIFIWKLFQCSISVVPNSGPRLPFASANDLGFDQKSARFELSHDIDTQSIYGFDQIIHRQPFNKLLDQEAISRNFSKRTLCPIPQHEELGLISHTVDVSEPQIQIGKPLRWFESGSVGSVHLGSSLEIFKEPISTVPTNNRRKSSIFVPWRKQSQNLINALRLTSRRASHLFVPNDEPVKEMRKEKSMPAKMNVMLEEDEYAPPPAENDEQCCCSVFKWFVRFFDLDLLRDNIYLNIMIGMVRLLFYYFIRSLSQCYKV